MRDGTFLLRIGLPEFDADLDTCWLCDLQQNATGEGLAFGLVDEDVNLSTAVATESTAGLTGCHSAVRLTRSRG